jgi:hypothetical protein
MRNERGNAPRKDGWYWSRGPRRTQREKTNRFPSKINSTWASDFHVVSGQNFSQWNRLYSSVVGEWNIIGEMCYVHYFCGRQETVTCVHYALLFPDNLEFVNGKGDAEFLIYIRKSIQRFRRKTERIDYLRDLGPPYTHSLAFRSTLTGKSVTVWPLPFLPHTCADKPAGR